MARKLASFAVKDLYDIFNEEWQKAPVRVSTHCFECGRPAAMTITICGKPEGVCECCAAELSEQMLAEAV